MSEKNKSVSKVKSVAFLLIGLIMGLGLLGAIAASSSNSDPAGFIYVTFLAIPSILFWLLPSFVAEKNNKQNTDAILLANVILGWVPILWIVFLIWATRKDDVAKVIIEQSSFTGQSSNLEDQLLELQELLDKGLISKDEYNEKRAAVLS